MLAEEAEARVRFASAAAIPWLSILLDLAEIREAPKKAGDCWRASEALIANRRYDQPTFERQGYVQHSSKL